MPTANVLALNRPGSAQVSSASTLAGGSSVFVVLIGTISY